MSNYCCSHCCTCSSCSCSGSYGSCGPCPCDCPEPIAECTEEDEDCCEDDACNDSFCEQGGGPDTPGCQNPFDPKCQILTYSPHPVRYHTGQIRQTVRDLTLTDGAFTFTHARKYDNLETIQDNSPNGLGWHVMNVPTLVNYHGRFWRAEFGERDSVHFALDPNASGIHIALQDFPDTMRRVSANKTILVIRANQSVWTFNDDPSRNAPLGSLMSVEATNGHVTEFVYDNSKRLTKVQAWHNSQPSQILGELEYTWDSSNRITAIVRRKRNGSVLQPIQRVSYTYHTGADAFGNAGNLRTVTMETAHGNNWIAGATYYYRYYKPVNSIEPKHLLKMAFFPEEFKYLSETFGATACFNVADSEALNFSTKYYEYDSSNRVILEKVDRHTKTITFAYTEYPAVQEYNAVHRETVETGHFGEQNIVFTNFKGNVLLKERKPPQGSGDEPCVHYRVLNNDGRQTHHYHPKAVLSYSVVPGVPGTPTRLSVSLSPNEGMIEMTEYLDDPLKSGRKKVVKEAIKQGIGGTPIIKSERTYEKRQIDARVAWKVSSATVYEDEANTKPITTHYAYTYHPNSLKVEQKTTTSPAVPTSQNGSGIATIRVDRFDAQGRPVWSKDELGIISYRQYNAITGSLVKTIQDVNTTQTADFANLPSGWTTASGAGKHLVSEFEYDFQGRMVQTLGPRNTAVNDANQSITVRPASWTVYDDANFTVRSASGFATMNGNNIASFTLVNPVSITIRGATGEVLEQIRATRTSTAGQLLPGNTFARASYIAWTKNIYQNGRLTATRQYHQIPANGDGAKNTHYLETTFGYDVFGRRDRTTSPDGTITKVEFDWKGNVVKTLVGTTDTNLVVVSETEYGDTGVCSTCTGQKDKPRVAIQHVDANTMRITEFGYDWRGRQVFTFGEEDADGNITYDKQTYDNLGRSVRAERFLLTPNTGTAQPTGSERLAVLRNDLADDILLARSEQFYDVRGRVWKTEQSVVNPTTGVVEKTLVSQSWFDAAGQTIKTTSPGTTRVSNMVYDSLGNVKQSYISDATGTIRYSQTDTTYDAVGNVIMVAQGDRLSTTSATGTLSQAGTPQARFRYSMMWYDGLGRSIATADYGYNGGSVPSRPVTVPARSASVLVQETKYDAGTGHSRHFDVANRESRTEVDAMGRTTKTIPVYTGNSVTDAAYITEYDAVNRTVTQIDPLGNQTKTEYGLSGRVDATIDAKNGCTEMAYNRLGEVVSQKDPMGRITTFEYDNLGRQIKITFPKPDAANASPVQTTVYNVQGLVAKEVDPLGHETKLEYDGLGRLVKKIDALNGTTTWVYDDEGKLISIKDPVNNTTSYFYDALSRVVSETNQLGHARTIEYLAGSLISKKTDRNGRYITFNYDSFDRQTHEHWYSSAGTLQRTVTSAYDAVGRFSSVSDPSGTHAFAYDNYDRNTKTTMTLAGLTPQVILDSTFDLGSRQLTSSVTIGATKDYLKTFGYDASNQVTSIVQQQQAGGNTLAPKRVEYVYNAAQQATAKNVYAATTATSKVFDTAAIYDGMGRLKKLTHKNGATVYSDYNLSWDAAGRVTYFDFTDGGTAKTGIYGYDNTDQLVTATYNGFQSNESYGYDANGNRNTNGFTVGTNNRLTSDGTFCYTYDNEGNRLTKTTISGGAVTSYTWDHRNRLVQVITPTAAVNYEYDYANRMTKRNNDVYVHDGYQVILLLNGAGAVQKRFFWGATHDELIAEETGSTPIWALCDHLGSVRDVISSAGAVLNHFEYNAFGGLIDKSSITDVPIFRYTAKLTDDITGLQWNINRWYDASTGQWISEDPIGFEAGDENLYRYTGNHPIASLDYFGLLTEKDVKSIDPLSTLWDDLFSLDTREFGVYWENAVTSNPFPILGVPTRVRGKWEGYMIGSVSTDEDSLCTRVGFTYEALFSLALVWGMAYNTPPLKTLKPQTTNKSPTKAWTKKEKDAQKEATQRAKKRIDDINSGKRGERPLPVDVSGASSSNSDVKYKCACRPSENFDMTGFVEVTLEGRGGLWVGGACSLSGRQSLSLISGKTELSWTGKCRSVSGVWGIEASLSLGVGASVTGDLSLDMSNNS